LDAIPGWHYLWQAVEYSLILWLMKWIRHRRVHLLGITFFFVFDFIFYYPKVFLNIGLKLPVYICICIVFALHIWFFNYGAVYLVHRVFTGLQHAVKKRLLAFLLVLPVNVLLVTVFQSFFFSLLNKGNGMPNFYVHYEDVGMNLLYSLIIVFFLELMHYFRNWTTAVTESAALKQKNMETQLDALKSQVNPHFLFNSLNSLSSLIQSNAAQAVDFVHKLSGVYRYLLQSNDRNLVELKEELAFLHAYLQLLQIRFGKALHYRITIDPAYEGYFIPPLTLQLLVENAVKHNVVSIDQPLSIEVYNADDKLAIKNNLQKRRSPVVSHGIGLVNLLARYGLVTKAEVAISETEEAFVVSLPLIKTSLHEGIDH
jgi:hypothetical protein